MKCLFILLVSTFLLNLHINAQDAGTLFLEAAVTRLEHAKEYTLKVAHLMPDDKYAFKPTPEEMTFAAQLLHLSANLGRLSATYLSNGTVENPVTREDAKLQDKEAIISVVTKTYDLALNTLKHFNPAHLADTVNFFAGPMNKLKIINLVNDHQTHHRGQMLVYLRLNGIKPPAYTGW